MVTGKAYTRPRPIKVAFLIEEHEHWKAMLDTIFAEAFGRWGGRFSLVVPCEHGHIRAAYVPWLEVFDPDIIYSYVELSDEAVDRLHERFHPAYLVQHDFNRDPNRDKHAHAPRLPMAALSVLSVAGILTRGSALSAPQPIPIVDVHLSVRPSRLLQQNFGCYGESLVPWPISGNMVSYLKPLTFVPQNIQTDRRIVPRAEGDVVGSEQQLLEAIGQRRNLVGLAQLSTFLAPRMELGHSAWSRTVNLVVGDSFADYVTFWNGIHHVPAWLHGQVVALTASPTDFGDPDRFAAISNIIKSRIHVPVRSNASHSQIAVRSVSLSQAELDDIAKRLREARTFQVFTAEHLESIDSVIPQPSAFEHAYPHVDPGLSFQPSDWHELVISDDAFRPPTIAPLHIRDMPQLPANLKQGGWALDLDIERTVDHSELQNVRHRWRLPRRLRMVSAFTRGYRLGSSTCMPRATVEGLLSLFAAVDGSLPEIKLPTDEQAFRTALCAPRDWWPFRPSSPRMKPGSFVDIRPSDKGRYLTALLRMSDGVRRAREVFLSNFWKDQFEALGGTAESTAERIKRVTTRLKRRLRTGQIAGEQDFDRIAGIVLAEARAERSPVRYLRFDRLRKDFDAHVAASRARAPSRERDPEWEQHEVQSLAASVRYLCRQEILHQGHEWRCRQCFNINWISLAGMKPMMSCEVCGTSCSAPVDESWHFKLNGFVLEGLREHGLLACVWCLSRIAQRAEASFYFLEAHELFLTGESADKEVPNFELDLLTVSDGVVRLCEAKTSRRRIDIAKFAELAKRVRPDIATLAIMEPASEALAQRAAELRQMLVDEDIKVELMTLEEHDFDDTTVLPSGTSFSVRVF